MDTAKFIIKRKVDLSYLGDEWKGCHVAFKALSYVATKDVLEKQKEYETDEAKSGFMVQILVDNFLEGMAPGNQQITKDDLVLFPADVIALFVSSFVGTPDPKG